MNDNLRNDPTLHPKVPIVGVGASAGGLEAFSLLIKVLPKDFGGAIVFVSHLALGRETDLVAILSRISRLPVTEITSGVVPQPHNVYVIPSKADVILKEGLLHLQPRQVELQPHMPIDTFLLSLAAENKALA